MPKELTPVADSYVEVMLAHGIMFRSRFACLGTHMNQEHMNLRMHAKATATSKISRRSAIRGLVLGAGSTFVSSSLRIHDCRRGSR
jgi:hypothetical protein